ncbi:MAG TPA: hypothetical protein VHT96_12210 [Clostridia bacterium]|nr:hypothetical protein [Clostridia bacterium]
MENTLVLGKTSKNLICAIILIFLTAITVYAAMAGNDGVFAPMLMAVQIFLMLWPFKPGKNEKKTAYYAIIAYGTIIGLFSVAMTVFGPSMGDALGWESHPDDRNGIVYPAVNDGRENCYFASFVFLFYYLVWIFQRLAVRRTSKAEA